VKVIRGNKTITNHLHRGFDSLTFENQLYSIFDLAGVKLFYGAIVGELSVFGFIISSYFISQLVLSCLQVRGKHHGCVWESIQTTTLKDFEDQFKITLFFNIRIY
jgi:hypothetical protein